MTRANGGITSIGTTLAFISGRACSDTLFHVLNRAFDNPMKIEEKASMPFAGGIMQHGYQCGMIWGAALAAGVKAHRLFGPGTQAETMAILASQKIVDSFRSRKNTINCLEITELDKSSTTMEQIIFFIVKGGTIGCFRMAAGYAPVAYREINAAFSEEQTKAPSMPVSCAAAVARKMGASEEHATMAAGLAGGIGLCGGACGALGAAIWIMGINSQKEPGGKMDYKDPRALKVIEQFMKSTDFEFECTKIAGRKFENVDDHARYISDGGCSEILEVLADDR